MFIEFVDIYINFYRYYVNLIEYTCCVEAHLWIIVYSTIGCDTEIKSMVDGSKQAWCLIQILAYSAESQYLWYLSAMYGSRIPTIRDLFLHYLYHIWGGQGVGLTFLCLVSICLEFQGIKWRTQWYHCWHTDNNYWSGLGQVRLCSFLLLQIPFSTGVFQTPVIYLKVLLGDRFQRCSM